MVEFLYTQEYDLQARLGSFKGSDANNIPQTHLSIYALGDMYAIPTLCRFALGALCKDMRHYCLRNEFLSAVPTLYNHAPADDRTLQDFVLKELRHQCMWISPDNVTEIAKHVGEVPQFRMDFCREFIRLAQEAEQRALSAAEGSSIMSVSP